MREIKFRAWIRAGEWEWHGEKRKFIMIDGSDLAFEEYLPLCDLLVDKDDEAYYMQFTGLKDNNGREIYEGDIVAVIDDKPMLVLWHEKFASFVIKREGWLFHHWFGETCNPNEVEILGNIYENPELLNSNSTDERSIKK